jgi:hypothetical protein
MPLMVETSYMCQLKFKLDQSKQNWRLNSSVAWVTFCVFCSHVCLGAMMMGSAGMGHFIMTLILGEKEITLWESKCMRIEELTLKTTYNCYKSGLAEGTWTSLATEQMLRIEHNTTILSSFHKSLSSTLKLPFSGIVLVPSFILQITLWHFFLSCQLSPLILILHLLDL